MVYMLYGKGNNAYIVLHRWTVYAYSGDNPYRDAHKEPLDRCGDMWRDRRSVPISAIWRNMDDRKHGRSECTAYTVRSVVTQ